MVKVKKAKIRKQYNQVPQLSRDTIRESDKKDKKHHIQESPEVITFQEGDHKAARNRQDRMTDKHENTNNKNDPQKKHRLGTVSKKVT